MCMVSICQVYFQPQYFHSFLLTYTTQAHMPNVFHASSLSLDLALCIPIISPHSCMTLCRGDGERDTLSKRKVTEGVCLPHGTTLKALPKTVTFQVTSVNSNIKSSCMQNVMERQR